MKDKHGLIEVEGAVSKYDKDSDGNLEISLKVDSFLNLPKLNAKENKALINGIKGISSLVYPILDNEEMPVLENQIKIRAGIPYSVSILRENYFILDGSLISFLAVINANKEEKYYFPLEM